MTSFSPDGLPYFPVMMHLTEIDGFKSIEKDLIKCAYDSRKKDPKGRVISNAGGWQSSFLHNENNIIRSTLLGGIGEYFESNNIFECNIILDSLWVNINGKGHYNKEHQHPNSDLSGVFWIKSPKNAGNLEFTSPHGFVQYKELNFYSKKYREDNKAHHTYEFYPVAGRIVIFPSFIVHRVLPNQSDEDRISVSFNILLNK